MKTSLGIWAFGGMATRFNPGGYKPELASASTVEKVRTAVEGLGDLIDDYEFHYPQELNDIPMMLVQHHESEYFTRRCIDTFDRLYREAQEAAERLVLEQPGLRQVARFAQFAITVT